MRTIKFGKKELPINASGLAITICMDELHCDLFKQTLVYLDYMINKSNKEMKLLQEQEDEKKYSEKNDAEKTGNNDILMSYPPADLTSKIMYCFIKAANPSLYKTYSDFMASTKSIKPFMDSDNLNTLCDEISDFYGTDDEDSEPSKVTDDSKKKKAE